MATITEARYRIRNIKSQNLYLAVQQDMIGQLGASLALQEFDNLNDDKALTSTQVWFLWEFRFGSYVMINQQSGYFAGIRGRSTDNGATAIYYYSQLLEDHGNFELWHFVEKNNNILIQNINSELYLGPHARNATVNNYIIQWSDQTDLDPYQEWMLQKL